mmetsp:Transcript_29281/g.56847  ORF Transcript_29281/g.56847 Transcript_29281/m.56847 type:complete len:210 (-) Transcript_29281:2033-2662(-)
MLFQVQRQRLEHPRAVMERHAAQGRAAHIAGKTAHSRHVEGIIACLRHHSAGYRAFNRSRACTGRNPLTGGKAVDLAHRRLLVLIVVDDQRVAERIALAGQYKACFDLVIFKRMIDQHLVFTFNHLGLAGRTDARAAGMRGLKVLGQGGFKHRLVLGHLYTVGRAIKRDLRGSAGAGFAGGDGLASQQPFLAGPEQLEFDLILAQTMGF